MSFQSEKNMYRAPARRLPSSSPYNSEREKLVEAHLPQVKYIAERIAAKLPPCVERDDLYSAGVLGLLDAIEKFDPGRQVLFKTYAELRVRGAILDSLRDQDWVPRSVRRRAREVEAAFQDIERERGRPAADTEVAARLGLTLPALQAVLDEVRSLTLTGLEQPDEADEMQPRQFADSAANTPAAHFECAEIRELLTSQISQLPERERQVIALYYVEELNMKEIGQALGVTESRVSQLRTQAFMRLRGKLSQLKDSLLPA